MRRAWKFLAIYGASSVVGSLLMGWLIRRGRNSWDDNVDAYRAHFPRVSVGDWDGR